MSWDGPVPGLELTVAQVVAHAAGGPLWYAVDLWSGPGDDAAFELAVRADAPNAARGLGLPFRPGADLAARVLTRLFPSHEVGDDPWRTLLWANGRIDLPGRPNQQGWRWHCAPLVEWKGAPPTLA